MYSSVNEAVKLAMTKNCMMYFWWHQQYCNISRRQASKSSLVNLEETGFVNRGYITSPAPGWLASAGRFVTIENSNSKITPGQNQITIGLTEHTIHMPPQPKMSNYEKKIIRIHLKLIKKCQFLKVLTKHRTEPFRKQAKGSRGTWLWLYPESHKGDYYEIFSDIFWVNQPSSVSSVSFKVDFLPTTSFRTYKILNSSQVKKHRNISVRTPQGNKTATFRTH